MAVATFATSNPLAVSLLSLGSSTGVSPGGGTLPNLNALLLSSTSATVGVAFSATISGRTVGSALALSGPGAASLSIAGTTVSGTPTTAGAVNLVETLAGYGNSPRTSSGVATVAASGSATYLPTVTTAPTGAYGLSKLLSAYSGPSVRVVRASDSVEQDIGFVGAAFDTAAATTFQGASTLSVKTWYDQTGGANHLTQPTAGSRPIMWLGEGGPALLRDNIVDGFMLIPATLTADRQNCTTIAVARSPVIGTSSAASFFEFGDLTTYDLALTSYQSSYGLQPYYDSTIPTPTTGNYDTQSIAELSVVGISSSASALTVYRDEQAAIFAATTSKTMSLGGQIMNTHSRGGRVDMTAFVFYPAALSGADYTAVQQALRTITSSALPLNLGIIAQGDSITVGSGSVNNRNITAQIAYRLARDVGLRNIASNGNQIGTGSLWDNSPTIAKRFSVQGKTNVLRVFLGSADLANAATVADVTAALANNCKFARTNGTSSIIIGVVALPRPQQPELRTKLGQLWDWFRSDPVDANGTRCFDAIVDMGSDPVMGYAVTDGGAGMSDVTIGGSDSVHPTPLAVTTRMVPMDVAALQATGAASYVTIPTTVGLPVNVTPPQISGAAGTASLLTVTAGVWDNTSGTPFTKLPFSYRYQWKKNGAAISGQVRNTYTTLSGDAGATITCTVDGINSAGTTSVTSPGLAISNALSIGGTPATTASVGTPYTFTPSAAGGTAPRTFTIASGTLPAGLTINSSTGAITGTPTTAATYASIVIRVTDAVAATADLAAFTITVAAAVQYMLDTVSATATAAYSLRKLRSGFPGAPIRVQRSSDNAQQDIPFDSTGKLDTANLLAFVGSGSGYIIRWYDQSVNVPQYDMGADTTGSQPRIVNAGTIELKNNLPMIAPIGKPMAPVSGMGQLTGSPTIRSVFAVSSHNVNTNSDLVVSGTGGFEIRYGSSTHTISLVKVGGAVIFTTTGGLPTGAAIGTSKVSYDGAAYDCTINGVSAASGSSALTFTAGALQSLFSAISTIHAGEIVFFDGALLSTGDQTAIQTSQKAYYGTA